MLISRVSRADQQGFPCCCCLTVWSLCLAQTRACPCCRLYNDFVDSVAIQTQSLRETQAVATADQQRLDEESLQRLKAEDAKAKVQPPPVL